MYLWWIWRGSNSVFHIDQWDCPCFTQIGLLNILQISFLLLLNWSVIITQYFLHCRGTCQEDIYLIIYLQGDNLFISITWLLYLSSRAILVDIIWQNCYDVSTNLAIWTEYSLTLASRIYQLFLVFHRTKQKTTFYKKPQTITDLITNRNMQKLFIRYFQHIVILNLSVMEFPLCIALDLWLNQWW